MRFFHAVIATFLTASLWLGCASTELPEQSSDATIHEDDGGQPDAGVGDAESDDVGDDAESPDDARDDVQGCVPDTCAALQACGAVDDGCGGSLDCGECPEVDRVKISPTGNQVLQAGADVPLSAVATATDGSQTFCDFVWSSQDPTVARVDTSGTVRGLAPGITDVRAQCRGVSDRVRFYVNDSGLPVELTDPDDLAIWFRADVGLNFSGGAQVEEWEDLSGNGFVVGNQTFSRHPMRVSSAINDKPALRFTGNQELRTTGSHVGLDEATVLVVAKNDQATHRGQILSNCTDAGNNQFRYDGSDTGLYFYGQDNGLDESVAVSTPTIDYGLLSVVLSSSQLRVFQNGQEQASVSVSPSGPWNFGQIGARCSSEHLEGEIAEIMAYGRALSDAERQQVEAYLTGRYAL